MAFESTSFSSEEFVIWLVLHDTRVKLAYVLCTGIWHLLPQDT